MTESAFTPLPEPAREAARVMLSDGVGGAIVNVTSVTAG